MELNSNQLTKEYKTKFKFKYLGMKWRFLKFKLEKESLPIIEKKGNKEILEQQNILEKSIILDSYEKGLNLSEIIQQQIKQTIPILPNSPSISPTTHLNNSNNNMNNNNFNMNSNLNNSQSLYEDSYASLHQYTTISEIDSVFTEEDILRGIKNMQIFKTIEPIKPTPPTTARQQTGPSRAIVFSPRPPENPRPSNIIIGSTTSQPQSIILPPRKNQSPRAFRKVKNRKSIPLKDQIQKLEISKSFKMYLILLYFVIFCFVCFFLF